MSRPLGYKHSNETRQKMRDAHKTRSPPSFETRLKLKYAKTGKKPDADTREKMSVAHKGHIVTEETRQKMRDALKGKPRSEETRKKISDAHIRRNLSSNCNKKAPNTNKKHKSTSPKKPKCKINKIPKIRASPTTETRNKIRMTLLGHTTSLNTKQKISNSLKGKYVRENAAAWKGGDLI